MAGTVRCPSDARAIFSKDLTDHDSRISSRAKMSSSFHSSIFGSVSILRSRIDRAPRLPIAPLPRVFRPCAVAATPRSDSISRTQVLSPGPNNSHVSKNHAPVLRYPRNCKCEMDQSGQQITARNMKSLWNILNEYKGWGVRHTMLVIRIP